MPFTSDAWRADSFYYRPRPESAEELGLLKRLDRIFTFEPFKSYIHRRLLLGYAGGPVRARRVIAAMVGPARCGGRAGRCKR